MLLFERAFKDVQETNGSEKGKHCCLYCMHPLQVRVTKIVFITKPALYFDHAIFILFFHVFLLILD